LENLPISYYLGFGFLEAKNMLIENKIIGFGRKIFKLHHPNKFGVNYSRLDIHKFEFQKILRTLSTNLP